MTYDEWLTRVFDHPVTDPPWTFTDPEDETDYAFADFYTRAPQIAVEYMTRTFREMMTLTQRFSDGQIALGLQFMISPGFSNVIFCLVDLKQSVDLQARLDCIASIYTVYEQLFAARCESPFALEKQPDAERNPLNHICFIWWDVFPMHGYPDQSEYAELDNAVLALFERILALESQACQQSVLYGLSEWHFRYPQRTSAIVKRFLADNPHISLELRADAENTFGAGAP